GFGACVRSGASPEPSPLPLSRRERGLEASEPAAVFARAFDVADAAVTEFGMIGMAADIVAAVPAAHAFGGGTYTGGDPCFRAIQIHPCRIVGTRRQRCQPQFGGDEEEAQFVGTLRIALLQRSIGMDDE